MTEKCASEQSDDKKIKKGKIRPIRKKSPAEEYAIPDICSVATEINATDPDFIPVCSDKKYIADVRVVVSVLDNMGQQSLRLNHRSIEVLDCGFNITLPAGFRIRAEAKPNWANRGLLVSNCFVENQCLKLTVVNIGKETPLVIPHKANVAHIWAEPVYLFNWEIK